MDDPFPEPGGSSGPTNQAEVEAYVRSYLTVNELQRSSDVIDAIAADFRSRTGITNRSWADRIPRLRWLSWAAGAMAAALSLMFLIGLPGGKTTLHVTDSESRSATLPPVLQIDLKAKKARMDGAGLTLLGSIDPVFANGVASLPVVLQSQNGSAIFQGTLWLTNAAGRKLKVAGAMLQGVLEIPDVGTNFVKASFIL